MQVRILVQELEGEYSRVRRFSPSPHRIRRVSSPKRFRNHLKVSASKPVGLCDYRRSDTKAESSWCSGRSKRAFVVGDLLVLRVGGVLQRQQPIATCTERSKGADGLLPPGAPIILEIIEYRSLETLYT